MITEIERVLNFFDSIDFVDDFGFQVSDFVVEFGLLGVGVEFAFETFLAHGLGGVYYSYCERGII